MLSVVVYGGVWYASASCLTTYQPIDLNKRYQLDSSATFQVSCGVSLQHILNSVTHGCVHACGRLCVCLSQNPALVEYPISLRLELNSAPKTTIKTSGATVAVTAIATVMVLPPGTAPVQLSSMTMVRSCLLMLFICQLLILKRFQRKSIRMVDI